MREGLVECKECRFWIQYVEEKEELKPMLSDFGLCLQSGADKWGLRTHKDMICEHGEPKKQEILP